MLLPDTIPAAFGTLLAGPGQPGGTAAPVTGAGLEVVAVDGNDYQTVLAVLPGYTGLQMSRLLGDKGSGSVSIPIDSPAITATGGAESSTLLGQENLWQVWQDGILRFEFLGETAQEVQVAANEQRTATITGPGTAQVLTWGRAMPPGWATAGGVIRKTAGILDPFAGFDGTGNQIQSTLNTTLWNLSSASGIALNPLGTVQITAVPGGTAMAGGPFDIAASSISASITPLGGGTAGAGGSTPSGPLNGSELTQMYVIATDGSGGYALIGLSHQAFYAQFKDAAGNIQTKTLATYDPTANQYWQITCNIAGVSPNDTGLGSVSRGQQSWLFQVSGDGINFHTVWQLNPASMWDPSHVNVYFACQYNVTNTQAMSVTQLNSGIVTPPSSGPIFLSQPIMATWLGLLSACKSRGTLPFVAPTFSRQMDSALAPWADSYSVQVPNGTDLYTLFTEYAGALNVNWRMDPGFRLVAGQQARGSLGIDRSQQIIFHDGEVITRNRTRARDQIANMTAGVDDAGQVWTAIDNPSIATWHQREWWATAAQSVDGNTTNAIVQASLGQLKDEVATKVLAIPYPGPAGKIPLKDFDVGDWIGLERVDFSATDAVRVIGIALAVDQDQSASCELTLQTYRAWLQEQFLYILNKYGGQFAATLGTLPGSLPGGGTGALPVLTTPSVGTLPGISAPPTVVSPLDQLTFNPATGMFTSTPLATTAAGLAAGGATSVIPGGIITPGTVAQAALGFTVNVGAVNVTVAPVAPGSPQSGDIWLDSSNGYQVNQWSGSAWVLSQFGGQAIANAAITGLQIAAATITAGKIAAGTITATQIAAGTITASLLAAGIVVAGIVDATTITGSIVRTSASAPLVQLDGPRDCIFVYNASAQLVASITSVGGSDGLGNTYLLGSTIYGPVGTGFAALQQTDAGITWYTATTMAGPWTSIGSVFPDASSNLNVNANNSVILRAAAAAAVPTVLTLQPGQPATVSNPDNNLYYLGMLSARTTGTVVFNSSAPKTVTGLSVLVQPGVYEFEAWVDLTADSSTYLGYLWLGGTATASVMRAWVNWLGNGVATTYKVQTSFGVNTGINAGLVNNADYLCWIKGSITINGAGTMVISGATSGGAGFTTHIRSTLRVWPSA